jgi:hypothetical protein
MADLLVEALQEQVETATVNARREAETVRMQMVQAERERYVSRQREIVRQAIPNVEQITASPEFQQFTERATPSVRALLESEHSDDGFAALQLYANWLQTTHPHLVAKPPSTNGSKPTTNAADKVLEDRAARLKTAGSAAVLGTRSPPISRKVGEESDEDALKFWETKFNERRT